MSPSSDAAVGHLQKLKPTEAWKIEYKKGTTGVPLVRLTRRAVPLTDSYFLDIVYDRDATNQVVGILAAPKGGKAQGQVLLDRHGKPVSGVNLVTVRYPPRNAPTTTTTNSGSTSRSAAPTANNNNNSTLTDAQNRDLLVYGGSIVAFAIAFRLVFDAMFGLYILAFPLLYLYLVFNCPAPESFDAKKELKRILRGHHLPENHQDKPKGLLEETLSRIQASVATEIATLPGYEVTLVPLGGALVIASCRVPSVKMDYYWVGVNHRWLYVYANPLQEA